MPSRIMYKHPSLKEFLSRSKENYDHYARLGVIKIVAWEEQEPLLRAEWQTADRLPEIGRNEFWRKRAAREKAGLQAFRNQLDKLIEASKLRGKAGESLKDAKQQEAHAKKKRSAGGKKRK